MRVIRLDAVPRRGIDSPGSAGFTVGALGITADAHLVVVRLAPPWRHRPAPGGGAAAARGRLGRRDGLRATTGSRWRSGPARRPSGSRTSRTRRAPSTASPRSSWRATSTSAASPAPRPRSTRPRRAPATGPGAGYGVVAAAARTFAARVALSSGVPPARRSSRRPPGARRGTSGRPRRRAAPGRPARQSAATSVGYDAKLVTPTRAAPGAHQRVELLERAAAQVVLLVADGHHVAVPGARSRRASRSARRCGRPPRRGRAAAARPGGVRRS